MITKIIFKSIPIGAGPAHQGRHVRQEHGAVGQCNIQAAQGQGGGDQEAKR